MKINIGKHEFTECWDDVLYKALSDYPKVNDNEMKDILDFTVYEKMNDRECEITADRQDILDYVLEEIKHPDKYKNVKRPEIIRECTACTARGGCMTDFVCHTAPLENAISILQCGSLLSAVNARKLPDTILQKEARNAANDPADYYYGYAGLHRKFIKNTYQPSSWETPGNIRKRVYSSCMGNRISINR